MTLLRPPVEAGGVTAHDPNAPMTRHSTWFLAAALAAPFAAAPARAADPFNEVAEKANQKMVKVFGAGGFSRLNSYGTGIIISPDGHVLTAASQLLDTSELVVHLYDGQRLKAQVLAVEPELDVAIIKIRVEGKKIEEPTGLNLDYFDFAAAAKRPPAETGDWVLALTNTFEIALRDEPLSLQRGVVMARTKLAGRRGVFEFPYTGDVYVVDAITNNPGAAGGALLTRKGELIGVVGREIKNSLSDTWMNYAIPVNAKVDIKEVVKTKDKDGKEKDEEKVTTVTMPDFVALGMQGKYKNVTRPKTVLGEGGYHGIVFVPNILDRTPAYVEDVVPGSPAAKAGLRPDDLVSFIDGEPVASINVFQTWLKKNTRPGQVVRIEVRRGEALQTIEMTLGVPPKAATPTPAPMPK
ncbi:serine protease : Serine protease, HtrA/DegQ/DegS family OS=uncultured planctomycete GN=HGMM_F01A04C12 PE=4 SV=1: Trypsin_2: PDZ_2 [Gemmataceae bacterium]|nr:serine protease : Serine protease, HtrA/DegQ/DegS family OS=uncultured planctomycete GN=HGMM_F01A04C12 PE=4 SV=1: Trypsin_2: PDZ_2 [Gemmataceae bacterium]VTT96602.1 serine protease : Serine protease, HtrA/DegQ/DegS family OS=uncultured planctomycete GN=HGMM_F01A04C12 PE=4 SV=1: Trypsin_2: PDZ_2 [Gemmataceae bacterium]